MAEDRGASAFLRTLSIPNFRNYIAGNFVSQFGLWTQRIAVQWLTWELTKSPSWLGLMAFAEFFPILLLSPLGGVLADRLNRLTALRLYIFLSGCLSGAIAALTLTGLISVETLLLLVLANSCVLAFNYPLRLSILPALVDRNSLTSAIGINSVGFNISRIGGPALAGLLIAEWNVAVSVSFTVFADIVFIVALYTVRLVHDREARPRRPVREMPLEIADAVRYVRSDPGLGPLVIVLVAISMFARPATDLFAGFAGDVFQRGSDGLAWLTAMQGVGAAVGSVVLAVRLGVTGLTGMLVRHVLFVGIAVAAFAASDVFPFALAAAVAMGYALVVVGVIEQTLMQAPVAEDMRGRVASLYILCARGFPALGALMMGGIAEYTGLQAPIAVGGVMCLVLWLWLHGRGGRMAAALERTPGSA